MGAKKYVVRQGFNFRVRDEKGNEKVFHEGDQVQLEQELGDVQHQLEYSDDKDRDAALKMEMKAQKASDSSFVVGVPQSAGIDHEALAAAISTGIAQAFSQIQKDQVAAPAGSGQQGA
jgi:hypothetical protein